jgi:Macrocin-O-methyltransferase (TylF).
MKRNAADNKLLSDQVSAFEIAVIRRELQKVIQSDISGDVVEFGCYLGTTSVFLARDLSETKRQLWLYDSFEGLPEKDSVDQNALGIDFKAGELSATRRQLMQNLQKAKPYQTEIRVKKAWFSDLTADDLPEEIAFAFLDGDFYQSIRRPLELIWPRLATNAIVVVDDYQNEALPGAQRAVDEWIDKYPRALKIESSLAIFTK